jgi:hypothetical protein
MYMESPRFHNQRECWRDLTTAQKVARVFVLSVLSGILPTVVYGLACQALGYTP